MPHRETTFRRAAVVGAICTLAAMAGCAPKDPRAGAELPGVVPAAEYELIQEPDATYGPLISRISAAAKSVKMSMYELVSPAAVNALIAAHLSGVDTKVLLDSAFHGRETNTRAFNMLQAAGVDARWAPADLIWHEKAIITDGSSVAVGTGNLSGRRYEATSRDFWVIDSNPADVAAITETFDADFGVGNVDRVPRGVAAPRLIWSPDARQSFLKVIAGTHKTLSIESEEFKDSAVAAAAAAAAGRGVQCRVVLNEDQASTPAVDKARAGGCTVRIVPTSKDGLYMHAKVVLADDQIVLGSQNLAPASLLDNRELSLMLDGATAPALIASVQHTFDTDFGAASAS